MTGSWGPLSGSRVPGRRGGRANGWPPIRAYFRPPRVCGEPAQLGRCQDVDAKGTLGRARARPLNQRPELGPPEAERLTGVSWRAEWTDDRAPATPTLQVKCPKGGWGEWPSWCSE